MENQPEPYGVMGIYLIDIYLVYIAVISVISSIMPLYTVFMIFLEMVMGVFIDFDNQRVMRFWKPYTSCI